MTVFSRDHKAIGLQYAITSMVLLLLGFGLMMVMRWHSARRKAAPYVQGPATQGRIPHDPSIYFPG